jgi:hypothetical protein
MSDRDILEWAICGSLEESFALVPTPGDPNRDQQQLQRKKK